MNEMTKEFRRKQNTARPSSRSREPVRENPSRRRRKRSNNQEFFVAASVIAGVILCMVIVIMVVQSVGAEDVPAHQTIAAPIRSEENSQQIASENNHIRSRGSFSQEEDFRQLSDPFLVLVNDEVALPDDWVVTPDLIGEQIVDVRISGELNQMIRAAQEDDIWLWVASGYRSVEDQERVLNTDIRLHMNEGMSEEEARELSLRTINRPGHSEHHTGFVVDLNDVDDCFEETEAYRWLSEHAADYGFVQRYRSDKVEITGIDNESWHYRYVGKEHAQEMQRLDMCLEEYVQYLKDQGVQ